jgi:hypothetical protein
MDSRARLRVDGLVVAVSVVWLLAAAGGLGVLWRYERGAGAAAAPPMAWPADSPLARTPGRATLVMLAHPRCPCSRASIEELNRILSRVADRLTTYVLFFRPSDFAAEWEQTDLWRAAERLPGVHVRTDEDGREARRFGSVTSGQVLLYDAAGRLRFTGGITPSRGHAGDNPGAAAVVALAGGEASGTDAAPVFGCSLLDPETPHAEAPDAL